MSTPSNVISAVIQLLQAQWSLTTPASANILWVDNKPDMIQFEQWNKSYVIAVYSPSSPVTTQALSREVWEIIENFQIDIYVEVTGTVDAASAIRESMREECYRILHLNQFSVSGQALVDIIRELQKVESPQAVRLCLLGEAISWDIH